MARKFTNKKKNRSKYGLSSRPVKRLGNYLRLIPSEIWILIGIYFVLVIRRAWMGDDPFITLRTIDNWMNGYGLTWNVNERVQTFTHPLWMFLLSGVYFFTREPYFTTLTVSLVVSLATVIIFAGSVGRSRFGLTLGLLVLILSSSYIDWSTSGLENPLSHLLLVVFCVGVFSQKKELRSKNLFTLSLIASLAMVNRLDTGLIYLPALLFLWWRAKDRKTALAALLLGQTPLFLWELFALVYYGFPFPNTYYAKLNTGLMAGEILEQGVVYFFDTLRFDPITLVAIFFATAVSLGSKYRWTLGPVGLGLILYLLYVLQIGGDFMSGRFFSLALLGAAALISRIDFADLTQEKRFIYMGAVVLLGLATPIPSFTTSDQAFQELDLRSTRISNERLWYSDTMGLLAQTRTTETPFHPLRVAGIEFREIAATTGSLVIFENPVGMEGYYGGPRVHLIDLNALGDPLLSKLPMVYDPFWRPGHFIRYQLIPGYFGTINTGENQIEDSALRTYYDYLDEIIRGDLWSLERFKTILNMNLGRFDYLINEFQYKYPEVVTLSYARVNDVADLPLSCSSAVQFKASGLLVSLPEESQHAKKLTIAIENNKSFRVYFMTDGRLVGEIILAASASEGINYLNVRAIPDEISEFGYDSLHILPLQGQEPYCFGFITLE